MKVSSLLKVGALVCLIISTGCVPIIVGSALMSRGQTQNANTKAQEAYDKYRSDMEAKNIELKKGNLPPEPIVSFKDWQAGKR
jgi:hypothetical protein